jgi:hypothetical protein
LYGALAQTLRLLASTHVVVAKTSVQDLLDGEQRAEVMMGNAIGLAVSCKRTLGK